MRRLEINSLTPSQLRVVEIVVAGGLRGGDHLIAGGEVLDLDLQLPLRRQHAFELLPGRVQAPLPRGLDLLQAASVASAVL